MSAIEFQRQWSRRFSGIEPVGYEMRNAGADCWVRFHSLPGSKRYSETDTDWNELLLRQNKIAAAVLGEGQNCWLVQSCWDVSQDVPNLVDQSQNDPFRAIADYVLEPAMVTLRETGTEFEQRWESFVGHMAWCSGAFDQLLREIADERAAPTLWFSSETGAVFAPYDGGVDLFLSEQKEVDNLAAQHSAWLSSHPLGL